jgi:hypothetical protein
VVEVYRSLGLSLRRHPVAFQRTELQPAEETPHRRIQVQTLHRCDYRLALRHQHLRLAQLRHDLLGRVGLLPRHT